MDTNSFFNSMDLKRCSLCNYVSPKKRANNTILSNEEQEWRMKNHYLSRSHTTNLRKSQLGNKFLDLSDEGFLEYYEKRLPAIDGFQERETYNGFIKQLKTNIEIRRLLNEEGVAKGYLKD
jgi:hypothetical protein